MRSVAASFVLVGAALALMMSFAAPPASAAAAAAAKKSATKSKPAATKAKAANSSQAKKKTATSTRKRTSTKRPVGRRSTRRRRSSGGNVGQQRPAPERVQEIEKALADKGFLAAEPDTNWDAATTDALRRFQQSQNINGDGRLSALSVIALGLGARQNAVVGAPTPPPATESDEAALTAATAQPLASTSAGESAAEDEATASREQATRQLAPARDATPAVTAVVTPATQKNGLEATPAAHEISSRQATAPRMPVVTPTAPETGTRQAPAARMPLITPTTQQDGLAHVAATSREATPAAQQTVARQIAVPETPKPAAIEATAAALKTDVTPEPDVSAKSAAPSTTPPQRAPISRPQPLIVPDFSVPQP